MRKIKFAKVKDIKQPMGGLKLEKILDQDHILGGFGPEWEVLNPDGKWLSLAWPEPEIQRVSDGDLYWCVTFSRNSIWRFIHLKRYGEDKNVSERFPAIGAGTIRGRGIGKRTAAEFGRKSGFVMQEDCPTLNTLDENYKPLDKEIFVLAGKNLEDYDIGYKYLASNNINSIKEGLKYSPVQVDVEPYAFNSKGYIVNSGQGYIHEVAIPEDMGAFWAVWDSESKQWLKFDKSYVFGSPMIHSFKKKELMTLELVKEESSPAVFVHSLPSDVYFGIADGDGITGGSLLKALSGTYKNAAIKKVKDGTILKERIVGEIAAKLSETGGWFEEFIKSLNS